MDRVSLTQKLRKDFTDSQIAAQTDGKSHPDWPTWVQEQGYAVAPDGMVQTKVEKVADAISKKPQ